MNLTFIGDIMLGRFVRDKYQQLPYELVSDEVKTELCKSSYVIANLESPITNIKSTNSLAFAGDESILEQMKWVSCFSLANNHINDFGKQGMADTIAALDTHSFSYNGLFKKEYLPIVLENGRNKIAVVMCTDILNYELESNCPYHIFRADSPQLNETITQLDKDGYFTILYIHCGSLFSRYPNPPIRNLLHSAIDAGAKCVITAHSHCLGGEYVYNGTPIFWSLGDFLMDGGSYRRRRSCFLTLTIENNVLKEWKITPTITNKYLEVVFPNEKEKRRIINGYNRVSKRLQRERKDYTKFYKYNYKKEMICHSLSTLHFLYDSKGFNGFVRMLRVRSKEVYRMIHRMIFDRSKTRYDEDGLGTNYKNEDIK